MYSAIVVSLFMSVVCIMLALEVIGLWLPGNMGDTVGKYSNSVRWLVTGIVISFAASVIDNVWWGIAWSLRYLDDPNWVWWFDHGVCSNIISRQGLKIFAAWCHVKAAVEAGIISDCSARAYLFFSIALGLAVSLFLIFL
jgi:hypothetical protein